MSQVNAIPITLGGTGANTAAQARANLGITSGSPGGASLTLQFNNAGTFDGVLNSSVDPSTGDVTLGAQFLLVDSTDVVGFGNGQLFSTIASSGIVFDATGAAIDGSGTGPINLTSAGGVSILDTSTAGLSIVELGTGTASFGTPDVGIAATESTGLFIFSLASEMDFDQSVSGVVTVSTILNAIGGLQINGVPVGPASYPNITSDADGISAIGNAGTLGITLDATNGGPGTGPINLTSTGGMLLHNTGDSAGIRLQSTDGGGIELTVDGAADGGFILNSNAGIVLQDFSSEGFDLDTSAGAGSIRMTSAGGVSITDNSATGIILSEANPTLGIQLIGANASQIIIDAGFSGLVFDSGGGSNMDFDVSVVGVATLSTILNAVGGYQANGVPGISGSGTSMTGVTVTNGLITAATFA